MSVAEARPETIDAAAAAALRAAPALARLPVATTAAALEAIAARIDGRAGDLVEVAASETRLGEDRLRGETGRASGQLRLFARMVARGEHLEAVIEPADPAATPPRPDLRRMRVPVGPVAVFSAGNFPFAFSVLGGDVASALAAGCPVVVKAHPGHPATSELSAELVRGALAESGCPEGAFGMVHGASHEVGERLVLDDRIQAVGFTGSLAGGRALFDLAARRPRPIPVYAEMGSVNPLFVSPGMLRDRPAEFADGVVGSLLLGNGQFCTKPGVVFAPREQAAMLVEELQARIAARAPGPVLYERVSGAHDAWLERAADLPGVRLLKGGDGDGGELTARAALAVVDWRVYRDTAELREEHFGPFGLVVACGEDELLEAAAAMDGSLTASVHSVPGEEAWAGRIIELAAAHAGRVVHNGFPTGVAVTAAMHHGGPYPAATFPEHTSVGSAAVRRFSRPVCYQNVPDELLPPALRAANPWRIHRTE